MELRRATVEGPDGAYTIAYTDWGGPPAGGAAARTVVCVHGLTRNGRDFDALAAALVAAEPGLRVICPDVVGRGRSDRLRDPAHYAVPTYIGHMIQLLAQLGVGEVDWVGTSMGGLIGMGLAAAGETSPIRRLVLNDVGPFLPKAALERIGTYVGQPYRFDTLEGLEAHLREVHAPFGPLTDAEWRHLAEHGARQLDEGSWAPGYDPAIAEPFRTGHDADLDLWEHWDRITCPVLVLRGAESDLLTAETARMMTERGPRAELVEFEGVGHAPALMDAEQIDVVKRWLGV